MNACSYFWHWSTWEELRTVGDKSSNLKLKHRGSNKGIEERIEV
jgi:hypothetical protein